MARERIQPQQVGETFKYGPPHDPYSWGGVGGPALISNELASLRDAGDLVS